MATHLVLLRVPLLRVVVLLADALVRSRAATASVGAAAAVGPVGAVRALRAAATVRVRASRAVAARSHLGLLRRAGLVVSLAGFDGRLSLHLARLVSLHRVASLAGTSAARQAVVARPCAGLAAYIVALLRALGVVTPASARLLGLVRAAAALLAAVAAVAAAALGRARLLGVTSPGLRPLSLVGLDFIVLATVLRSVTSSQVNVRGRSHDNWADHTGVGGGEGILSGLSEVVADVRELGPLGEGGCADDGEQDSA